MRVDRSPDRDDGLFFHVGKHVPTEPTGSVLIQGGDRYKDLQRNNQPDESGNSAGFERRNVPVGRKLGHES